MTPPCLSIPTTTKCEEEMKLTPASPCSMTAPEPKLSLATVPEAESLTSPINPPDDYDPCVGAKPCSPFYRHATQSSKIERLTIQTKRSLSIRKSPIEDVEARPAWRRLYDDDAQNRRESKLWIPEKRHCDCMQGLTRKQRILVKAAIAVVILGSMVAIALGITAAVGGGVWKSDNRQQAFGG